MSAGSVFIVDDNPANLSVLAGLLREHGYEVRVATNGQHALTAIAKAPPDLIMLDVMMPEMDGYHVCQRLKESSETRSIPVIFISALDDVLDKVRAFKAGGVDFVSKPFEVEEVLARVECQVSIARLREELERKNRELAQANNLLSHANRMLHSLSHLDALTGVANRRHFEEALDREIRRSRRSGRPVSLLMLDIDFFKRLNDSYGHPVGDKCLKQVAAALTASLQRPGDLAARYGGEEFAVLLPATELDGAMLVAEEVRVGIEALGLPHEQSPFGVVTVSIGVAEADPSAEPEPSDLVAAADQALYRSKESGRNRTTAARTVQGAGAPGA